MIPMGMDREHDAEHLREQVAVLRASNEDLMRKMGRRVVQTGHSGRRAAQRGHSNVMQPVRRNAPQNAGPILMRIQRL